MAARIAEFGSAMDFRPLNIEKDPAAQGFEPYGYDLVIAANVLHATRDLGETLPHCRELVAPSGQVVALENMQGRGWHDLTFGRLDGWWRFDDVYRPRHATASSPAWCRALSDSGFEEVAVLGAEDGNGERQLGSEVILAQGPEKTTEPDGIWVLASDDSGVAAEMGAELSARNQTVVLASQTQESGLPANEDGIVRMSVTADARESWRSLLEGLPRDAPLEGVVHLMALDGHGPQATTTDLADDVRRAGAGALALVQGLLDSDIVPTKGLWLFTRGALALERDYMRESVGQLAGATLWGFGKSVVREAPHLHPRMIDLDHAEEAPVSNLVNELMFPDRENHIAYRDGSRQVARLVRGGSGRARLTIPDEQGWRLTPAEDGTLERLHPAPAPRRPLQQGEVRVAVEAAGLNFRGVLISLGAIDSDMPMGEEFCGRIVEVASNVAGLTVGDRVVGLGFGAFAPEIVTRAELVAPAGVQAAALDAIPSAFVSAELAFQMARLRAGDRVLVHTASGGVGLAAIQLAQAAGAEVFATASAPKQAYLRSLGIAHVFDSRTSDFGQDVVEATGGAGVDMVLNSLTGPGFVEANLACLSPSGRFIELGRRDIWSREAMSEARPDVDYSVLELDALKQYEPERPGAVLRSVMERLSTGELTPLAHTRWPMAEVAAGMEFMRSARHIGKNVIAMPPLADGRLRADRTYLVTGGLGGIGCLVAQWLADRGAGASC